MLNCSNLAAWQTTVYWLMGSLTNNSRKLANFVAFYKGTTQESDISIITDSRLGIQSAGGAIAYRVDALEAPYMHEFGAAWGLCAGSLVVAAPVILMKVRDTVPLEDDLKFSDEAAADVVGEDNARSSSVSDEKI